VAKRRKRAKKGKRVGAGKPRKKKQPEVKAPERRGVNKFLLAAVIVVIASLALFSQEKSGAASVRDGMLAAVDEVESYRVNTSIKVTTAGVADGAPFAVTQVITGSGATDVAGKRMSMDMTLSQEGASESTSLYVIDNKLYTQQAGVWLSQVVPESFGVWEKRYQIKQHARVLAGSEVSIIQETGDVIVLDAVPDAELMAEFIAEQINPLGAAGQDIEALKDLIKGVSVRVWVGKADLLPRRFEMKTVVEVRGVSRETDIVMDVWDYNTDLSITLPEEAVGAPQYAMQI